MSDKANWQNGNLTSQGTELRVLGGLLVLVTGSLFLLERALDTGWLPMLIFPACGFLFIAGGMRRHRFGLVVAGCLLAGTGSGMGIALGRLAMLNWRERIGYGLALFACGWIGITLFSLIMGRGAAWWPLILAGVAGGAAAPFLLTRVLFLDFCMFIAVGLGLAFLIWGTAERLVGLIIPGSLLVTTGPGVYFPWRNFAAGNGLTPTGEMLAWLALGWGLIIIFFKITHEKFIWWPLIPGGVLMMVGWGLYIGGNPQSAASFISNSSSVALIIVGLYLLLLRRGIRK